MIIKTKINELELERKREYIHLAGKRVVAFGT